MASVSPQFSRDIGTRDASVVLLSWALSTANVDGLPFEMPEWWLAAQPVAYQTKMHNSNNAFEIGASIKAFQQARDAFAKKSQQNKSRLANAMQPQGQVAFLLPVPCRWAVPAR